MLNKSLESRIKEEIFNKSKHSQLDEKQVDLLKGAIKKLDQRINENAQGR